MKNTAGLIDTSTVVDIATLLGGLAGSYAAHIHDKLAAQPLSFWENECWVGACSLTGRIIGMALTRPIKPIKQCK